MDRIQQVEVRLAREIDNLAARFDGLESQMSSLKEEIVISVQGQISSLKEEIVNSVQGQVSSLQDEMIKSFQRLNDRVLSLIEDNLDVRANQRAILRRLNDLEATVKTS
jgi:hypothetical protein